MSEQTIGYAQEFKLVKLGAQFVSVTGPHKQEVPAP